MGPQKTRTDWQIGQELLFVKLFIKLFIKLLQERNFCEISLHVPLHDPGVASGQTAEFTCLIALKLVELDVLRADHN